MGLVVCLLPAPQQALKILEDTRPNECLISSVFCVKCGRAFVFAMPMKFSETCFRHNRGLKKKSDVSKKFKLQVKVVIFSPFPLPLSPHP